MVGAGVEMVVRRTDEDVVESSNDEVVVGRNDDENKVECSGVEVAGPVELVVLDAALGATVLDTVVASVVGAGVEMIVRREDDDVVDCADVEVVVDVVDDVVAECSDVEVVGPVEIVKFVGEVVDATVLSTVDK